jgi:hypothetical protein
MKDKNATDDQLISEKQIFKRVLEMSQIEIDPNLINSIFDSGEFESVLKGMIHLFARRLNKIVELCKRLEILLLASDPITGNFGKAAHSYLIHECNPVIDMIDRFFGFYESIPKSVIRYEAYYDIYSTFVLLNTLIYEVKKLERILIGEDPIGFIEEEGYDPEYPAVKYSPIDPRTAINQTLMIARFIESFLIESLDINFKDPLATPSTMETVDADR